MRGNYDLVADRLLNDLASRGIQIRPVGADLRLKPVNRLDEALLARVREHKRDLLRILTPGRSIADSFPGGVTGATRSITVEELCAMPLDDFAQAKLQIEVHSGVLDEVVIFASDNTHIDPGERRVVYRATELRELSQIRPTPHELSAIHEAKRTFGATITAT